MPCTPCHDASTSTNPSCLGEFSMSQRSFLRPASLWPSLWIVALAGVYPTATAEDTVRIEKKGDTIVVSLGGSEWAFYQTSRRYQKPFSSPVRSPGGTIVTRSLEDAKD